GQIIITGISVKDDDAGDNNITVTLQTNNGSITVKDNVNNGLTWRDIREDKLGVIILNGTVSQINNTLKDKQALTYQTQTDFNGIDTLTVTVNDNGKQVSNLEAIIYPPGALNSQTDSKVIDINIEPLNDNPQLSRSPNKPPDQGSLQPNTQRLTKQQAVNVVESWLKVKAQAFGNTYNEQVVYQYTTDSYRDKQLGKVGWLRRNNAYEIWVTPSVEPLGDVLDRGNEVVINIQARESVTRYQGGVLDPNYTRSLSGTYRFTLQLDDGIWKVANSEEIN
ncbi:MAG: ARC6/PARC6 family protein, partial [Microcystis aeruginosa]